MNNLEKLKIKWLLNDAKPFYIARNEEINYFLSVNNVLMPKDLLEYFKVLNGTGGEYDDNFFQFYSLLQFKKISDEFKDWENGIQNYRNLEKTLPYFDNYYVFANYFNFLFTYAIRLYPHNDKTNEILVLCGDEYKKIANSFSEFIDLYLNDSEQLLL